MSQVSMLKQLVPSMALLCCGSIYAAETVSVEHYEIEPQANFTSRDKKTSYNIIAGAAAGVDDNVYTDSRNEVDDTFFYLMGGILLDYKPTRNSELSFDLVLKNRTYSTESDRDLFGGYFDLGYDQQDKMMNWGVDLGYDVVDDPDVQTGEQIEHADLSAGANFTYNVNKMSDVVVAFSYLNVDYKEGTRLIGNSQLYDEEERDNTNIALDLKYAYKLGSSASVSGKLTYDNTAYKVDRKFNDSDGLTLKVGYEAKTGKRTSVFVDLGYETRSYSDDFAKNVAYDDKDVAGFVGTAGLEYSYREGGKVDASIYSDIADSQSANAYYLTGFQANVTHKFPKRFTGIAGIRWYNTKDSGAAAGIQELERSTLGIKLSGQYHLKSGWAFGATINNESSAGEDNLSQDYDRMIISIDAAAAW